MTEVSPKPTWEDSVTGNSTAVTLPSGYGVLHIKSASTLVAELAISVDDGDTFQSTGDVLTEDVSRAIGQNTPCKARLEVSGGSCDVLISYPTNNPARY
ncbi:MAG: hypothetical protein JKY59_00055 [Emcibacter sp.]|nr:hypothetical protein [Emcibacter sp.]